MDIDLQNRWREFTSRATLTVCLVSWGFALLSFETAYGKEATVKSPVKYSQIRIYISSKDDILSISQTGLVFDHIDYQGTYFDVVLNDQEIELLKTTSLRYDIVVDDLEAEYRRRPKLTKAQMQALEAEMRQQFNIQCFGLGSMGGYYTFDEVVAKLDEMRSAYPSLISAKQSIGSSIEGRDLWMVRISDNPDVDESEEEILYTALTHAREPQGMATVMFYMCHLLETYGIDPEATFLVDNRELYFVPVVNPDGYVYNQNINPNGGGLWRKNRRDNGDGSFGVDLNRNYGFKWGFNNSGSSPSTFSETYRGTAPFSEPETQVARDFALDHNFTMAFNYHTYGNYLIFSWDYKSNFFTPDHFFFLSRAQNMTQFNNYTYGTPNQTVGYVVNGGANDWFYGEQTQKGKVFNFVPEVGGSSDGFWPIPSRIVPLAQENVYPNTVLAWGLSGPPAPLAVAVAPNNPPIRIPSGGGQLTCTVTLTNNSTSTQVFQVWSMFVQPNGSTSGPKFGPVTQELPAGQTRIRQLTQTVSGGSAAGHYTFAFNAGTFSNNIIATASFPFTKLGAGSPAAASVSATPDTETKRPLDLSERGELRTEAEAELLPEALVLEQNYPNPFNPSTTITYQLPKAEKVRIIIYDLSGRLVRALVNEFQDAGRHLTRWDGRNQAGQVVASGLYVYQIRAGEFVQSHKMLFMK